MLIKRAVRHPELGNHAARRSISIAASSSAPRGGCRRRRRCRRAALLEARRAARPLPRAQALPNVKKSPLSVTDEKVNSWNEITTYNNYYEFGTDKDSPSRLASRLKTEPWTCRRRRVRRRRAPMPLDDILKGETLEERVYRLRCVEAWSMVIPWVGFPLANLIKRVRADVEGEVRRVRDAQRSGADAGRAQPRAAAGRTSKGSGWTKRCTR